MKIRFLVTTHNTFSNLNCSLVLVLFCIYFILFKRALLSLTHYRYRKNVELQLISLSEECLKLKRGHGWLLFSCCSQYIHNSNMWKRNIVLKYIYGKFSDCARDHEMMKRKIRWIIKDWFRCDFKLQSRRDFNLLMRCDNIMMLYSRIEMRWVR